MAMEFPKGPEPQKRAAAEYEQRLWQKAEGLSAQRAALKETSEALFAEVASMRARNLNLHERDILREKETEYWKVDAELQKISEMDSKIETQLRSLAEGTVNQSELDQLIPPQPVEKLSKRRQRILEEQQRLGESSSDLFPMEPFGGADPARLTTGRHQTGIKGNIDPLTAEQEFYYRTADTHGGKVGHGKDGKHYVSASGKRVRKK